MWNFGVRSRFLDVIYGVRPTNRSPAQYKIFQRTVFNYVGELSSKCISVNCLVGELSRFRLNKAETYWVRKVYPNVLKAPCFCTLFH